MPASTAPPPADPVAELAVRNRLALWGARLLAPVHENGRLHGLIALGVRDDGQPYDEADRTRAVQFARLLRHFLVKAGHISRLHHLAEQATLGAKYLPGTLVLAADENPPRQVPLIVRELIGQARRAREICRATPTDGQPFRASAGLIAETGGQNAMIVDSSALAEQVVADVIASAFDSAGQRCSALRVLCLQEEIADRVLQMLKGANYFRQLCATCLMGELRLGLMRSRAL